MRESHAKGVKFTRLSQYHEIVFQSILVSREQYARRKSGELAPVWAKRHPYLFDTDDLRLARNQCSLGYHFFEWLGAVMLHHAIGHHAIGHHALISKYEFSNHTRKREVISKLLSPELISVLRDRTMHGSAQAPDLLMFAPDLSTYVFCEVKGPRDRISDAQRSKFAALGRLTGQPVRMLRFSWI